MKKRAGARRPRVPSSTPKAKAGGSGTRNSRKTAWVVGAIAAFALLAALAGSFFLHRILATGKIREWVNGHPEKLRLEYASAEGWTPWGVHVRGLELRSRDSNVEWWLRVEDATFSFEPLALAGHRFQVTRLRGSGVSYRLRVREEPATTAPEHFAADPPIPGFPERPLPPDASATPAAPARGLTPSGSARPFHIGIQDIRLDHLREIWIELYRFHGETGSITGSFSLAAGTRAEVGPSGVILTDAELDLGKHVLLRHASFDTSTTIRPFDPRLVKGDAVWPFISGRVRLSGALASLSFLNYFLEGAEPHLSGGAGTGRVAIDVDKGHGKGDVSLDGRAFSAKYARATLQGNIAVRMRLTDWDFVRSRISFPGSRIDLSNVRAGEPGPDSRDWWGRFNLPSADIVSARTPPFQASVGLRARDARPLFTLFEVGLPGWARGILKLEGFDGKAQVGFGPRYTSVQGLDASGGAFRLRGRYLERKTGNGAFLLESGALNLGVEIASGKPKLKLLGAKTWFEEAAAKR